jgi:hypothetical protein
MYIDEVMQRVHEGLDKMHKINTDQEQMLRKGQWLMATQMGEIFLQTEAEVESLILIYKALK